MPESNTQAPPAGGIVRLAAGPGFSAPSSSVDGLPGPRGLPLIGNLHQLDRLAMHATLERFARRYGSLFRAQFGKTRAICIAEPTLIGEILRHRPRQVTRSPKLSNLIDETGFKGLFTAEGDAWRRQRKLVMRALTPEAVRHFFPVILDMITRRLRKRWVDATAAGRTIDVPRDLKRYSIDVTTWLAMGIDVDTLNHEDNPLQGDVELWFATIGRRLPIRFRLREPNSPTS